MFSLSTLASSQALTLTALFIVRQLIPSFTRAVEPSFRVVAVVQTMTIVRLAFIDV